MASVDPAPVTLERRIRADLEQRIRSGEWPPGHRIPTEHVLTAHYGCARMTVSKALAALVQGGLVERRRRAGSFVARPRAQTAVLEIPDIAAVIADRGEHYRFKRLSRTLRFLDRNDAQEAALSGNGPVLAVSGLHFADDRPFALEQRLLNLDEVPDAEGLPFNQESPGSWLLRHVPWTEARHRIAAVNADANTARQLEIERARACLQVERHTFRMGEWITFVRLTFPGDRYVLTAAFEP